MRSSWNGQFAFHDRPLFFRPGLVPRDYVAGHRARFVPPFRLYLLASFAKRRIGKPPSSRSLGLDQVPESLLPTLLCQHALSLTAMDVVAVVLLFVGMELFLSKLLYKLHVRDRPY